MYGAVNIFRFSATMRSFDDEQGNPWQAALMEASYGNIMLIFSRNETDDTRQTLLSAAHLREAESMLAQADRTTLCKLLSEARPWGS